VSARGEVRPAGNGPAPTPTVRCRYCREQGWLCTPAARCDEHRVDRDPVRAFRFLKGGSFILDGVEEPSGE
jgi:hypothetical protein